MAYAHEGFSGMNGRTDSAEYFYQSDFQTVLSFAQSVGLGRFTFWSVNRDRECNPPDNNGSLSSECSSVTQNPWDFTAYTVAFAKSAPVTEPSPTAHANVDDESDARRRSDADHVRLLHGPRLVLKRDLRLRQRRVVRRRPVDRQPVELRRGAWRPVGRVEQRRRLLNAQPRCPGLPQARGAAAPPTAEVLTIAQRPGQRGRVARAVPRSWCKRSSPLVMSC